MYDVSLRLDTSSSTCPGLIATVKTITAAQSLNDTMRSQLIRTFNPATNPVIFKAVENNGQDVPTDFLCVPLYDGTSMSLVTLDASGCFERIQKTTDMILSCSERYPITIDPEIDAVSRANLCALYYGEPGLAWVTCMEAGILTAEDVQGMCTTAGVPKTWY